MFHWSTGACSAISRHRIQLCAITDLPNRHQKACKVMVSEIAVEAKKTWSSFLLQENPGDESSGRAVQHFVAPYTLLLIATGGRWQGRTTSLCQLPEYLPLLIPTVSKSIACLEIMFGWLVHTVYKQQSGTVTVWCRPTQLTWAHPNGVPSYSGEGGGGGGRQLLAANTKSRSGCWASVRKRWKLFLLFSLISFFFFLQIVLSQYFYSWYGFSQAESGWVREVSKVTYYLV